jgi:Flp pilus assembly protein TadG
MNAPSPAAHIRLLAFTHRCQPAQATMEFALVVLIFLGALMTMFEGARLVASTFAVSNAAADGARAGAFVPTSGQPVSTLDASIRTGVRATTAFLGSIPDDAIAICRRATPTATCGSTPVKSGSVLDVTVTYPFGLAPSAGGWLRQATIPLTGYYRARID